MQTIIGYEPFRVDPDARPWRDRGRWPCAWVALPGASAPLVAAYRLRFTLGEAATLRAHVTADERYELFLDGARVGRGPERGTPDHWFFETYDLALAPGDHTLVAMVWSLGGLGPQAQMSVRHGFLFAPEGDWADRLGTGVAPWEARAVPGYAFVPPLAAKWRGHRVQLDGAAFPWGVERGAGEGWAPAETVEAAACRVFDWEITPRHRLAPATLPPQLSRELHVGVARLVAEAPSLDTQRTPVRAADHLAAEAGAWQSLLAGVGSVTVPAGGGRRVVVDLGDYFCAYPELAVSGGAGGAVRVLWAESLRHTPEAWVHDKGHRDETEGKFFVGEGDTFLTEGGTGRHYRPLWWHAGRYLEIVALAGDSPLTIDSFALRETRYPLEDHGRFAASDERLAAITPILVRGMQMDAHETFADSPYYEELMYAGDTRLECLCTYVMTTDERLPRKALRMFDASRGPGGLTQSRYPCRVPQVIAPFALWWVGMVHDYALWRGDGGVLTGLLPGARQTLEAFERDLGPDGLLGAQEGWSTIDWVPDWEAGIPPAALDGPSGLLNWQLVYTLATWAEVEALAGAPELAALYRGRAARLAEHATATFWDEGRGLLADDPARTSFSEHTQCMAILSGLLPPELQARLTAGLLGDPDLERATIYFSHYLFEALRAVGRADAIWGRMELWFDLARRGFKCPVESPEPSRSDCHAWGSHPLYHYYATILGVRPAGLGFREVVVAPQLGPLAWAQGTLPHPAGTITVDLRRDGEALRGSVTLPEGLAGRFVWGEIERRLAPGVTLIG